MPEIIVYAVEGRSPETKKALMKDITDAMVEMMRDNEVSTEMRKRTLKDLHRMNLTESRRKLAFVYKTHFEKLRQNRPASAGAA